MGILKTIFTWWDGATFGTSLAVRRMRRIGEDSQGNVYYEGKPDMNGLPRRWVIYNGPNDASRVPPEWFSWLQHQRDTPRSESTPVVRPWQKPAMPNMTGTPEAYHPAGAFGGKRAHAVGDYEAWTPDA